MKEFDEVKKMKMDKREIIVKGDCKHMTRKREYPFQMCQRDGLPCIGKRCEHYEPIAV
jgi:hypothetical protein